MSKSDFIRSLQDESKTISPSDVSQRVRQEIGCVSIYQGDPELDVADYRGYMIKFADKPDRSAENPELYNCVISTKQSKAWQDLVWIKEILQIFDSINHKTDDKKKLELMLQNRTANSPNGDDTPLNVVADKQGFLRKSPRSAVHRLRTRSQKRK